MSVEWTDILMTIFTGVIAIFAYLNYKIYKITYRAYRLMSRPIVFARLRDGKEEPGIIIENAGKGAAWNGKVVVTAIPSESKNEYVFTRLYEQSIYEYPIERDKKIKIKITYEDEEKGGEKYEWEGDFELHKEWLDSKIRNESQPEQYSQSKRYERLWHLYEVLVQLVMHEGRFVSERTNNFLLFNSILFTGFLLLATQVGNISIWFIALKVALPAVGLIMSMLHSISISHTINAADFWRSSISLIEDDPEFFLPAKVDLDLDLDIFKARRRYLNGKKTRQLHHALRLSQPPSFIKKLSSHLPHPNRIFVFWLPSLIGILWLLALILSCVQLLYPKI